MANILDVDVSDTWTDVYGVTGITVGSPLEIMVKGVVGVYIMESPTQPTGSVGKPMTGVGGNYATASVLSGSDKIWLRCFSSQVDTVVSVQERL